MSSSHATSLSYFISHAVHDLLDVDARPLGEQSSRELYIKAGVDERACPYDDRRALTGKPMNVAALRQVSTCWKDVRAQLERITALVAAAHNVRGDFLPAHLMWHVHQLALSGPAFFKVAHPTTPVPRALSALFKTSLGYATILPSLLLSQPGTADVPLCEVLPEDDFFMLTDQQNWLEGQSQVCAGSAVFIKTSYTAMGRIIRHAPPVHEVFEEDDAIARKANALAHAWHKLMGAAIQTRALIRQGKADDYEGYGERYSPTRSYARWPMCMQLYNHPNAPRHFALTRSMPSLELAHVQRMYGSTSGTFIQAQCTSFAQIDTMLERICHELGLALFGAHITDIRTALGLT